MEGVLFRGTVLCAKAWGGHRLGGLREQHAAGVQGGRPGGGRESQGQVAGLESDGTMGPFEQRSHMIRLAFLKVVAGEGEKWAESGNSEDRATRICGRTGCGEQVKGLGP